MAERAKPRLYSIPIHRAFADALADGLIRRFGDDPMTLARGMILLPTNRAKRAISDAFVRASGGGLLLPRLIAIGDAELDEAASALFDPADDSAPVPPAVAPLARRMILARLVQAERALGGKAIGGVEALRLAGDLARTLDQMLVEQVEPHQLFKLSSDDAMSDHWQRALDLFRLMLERWPAELEAIGRIDLADRRNRLLARTAGAWLKTPPQGFVCAAGITTGAPAVAALLRVVSELPNGMVVLPGLGIDMPADQWESLGPFPRDAETGRRRAAIESHPQYHLKLLLDRMGVNCAEFTLWRGGSDHDAAPQRSRVVATALAPATFTHGWNALAPIERRLTGVRMLAMPTPAAEAQAIAIALRQALETPGRTAALVTPDRVLARRVSAHCARWGIAIDDTAGQALSLLPPGTLLLALAEAVAQRFAPVALLALLKHPLVRFGEARLGWLDGVRRLDLVLRGPRPSPGLDGIERFLGDAQARDARERAAVMSDWQAIRPLLDPLAAIAVAGPQPLAVQIAALRDAATALAGDAAWARIDGRAVADLLSEIEIQAPHGPAQSDPADLPALLRLMLDDVAVRPPQGGHPRLAIYGLLEARLQTADLMILGGLNEAVWPALPAPDPWLAPRIRAELDLPALERRIGLSAHDLAGAMGAPDILLTRSERDATSPTIASRFWLRLEALAGDRALRDDALATLAMGIDDPGEHRPASKPMPSPPVAARPRRISVTEVDRLKADPYTFYARRMLRLASLDPVDADNGPAWRGTAVHRVFETWAKSDRDFPERLHDHARALMDDEATHPMMRALWQPRLMAAIDWMAARLVEQRAEGRTIIDVEQTGHIEIAGVELRGTFDRIDRMADGSLAIVDYKTGKPPSARAVRQGFSLQLGLLGLIAERGGFPGIAGQARGFEYWSMSKAGTDGFGFIDSPVDPRKREPIAADAFVSIAADHFTEAAGEWLTGARAFEAKLHPDYAPYAEYDQLMRRDEWWGRD